MYSKEDWRLQQNRSGSLLIVSGTKWVAQTSVASSLVEADEVLANAHLIAAAPQLLDACQVALGAMATFDQDKGWVKEITSVIQQALSKAKGDQHE